MFVKMNYERDVFYYETDRMGIVHHSNYIRWLEESRVYYLQQVGMPFHEIEKMGILVPVLHVEFDYRKPFRFGEHFQVEVSIEKFNGMKMDFAYRVYEPVSGELRGTGRSEHCFTNENMEILRLKTERKELYEQILVCCTE